jgi:hypothetical protein
VYEQAEQTAQRGRDVNGGKVRLLRHGEGLMLNRVLLAMDIVAQKKKSSETKEDGMSYPEAHK